MASILLKEETKYTYAEAKRCPFCGSDNLQFHETQEHTWVGCGYCGGRSGKVYTATISLTDGRKEALKVWNARFEV